MPVSAEERQLAGWCVAPSATRMCICARVYVHALALALARVTNLTLLDLGRAP